MKILFDHPSPFLLAHGGFQTQIEETRRALQGLDLAVEYLRWWDESSSGDLIHHFSPATPDYLLHARAKGIPVVMTTLFTETCNRSPARLTRQKWATRAILALPGGGNFKAKMGWSSFHLCTMNVVGLEAERRVLLDVFGVPSERISVIPLGLSETYLTAGLTKQTDSQHLICTGTITQRKQSIEIAKMARATQTRVLFVGKPYHLSDPYWLRFRDLIDGKFVIYHEHVEQSAEMVRLLQEARGFVLMSKYENWCLSAHEAAACGLPLLVPDQPWSRECFGDQARYFSKKRPARNTRILREFYEDALTLPAPQIKRYRWADTAEALHRVYRKILG